MYDYIYQPILKIESGLAIIYQNYIKLYKIIISNNSIWKLYLVLRYIKLTHNMS